MKRDQLGRLVLTNAQNGNEYSIISSVGNGAFGYVSKAEQKNSSRFVAIKRMNRHYRIVEDQGGIEAAIARFDKEAKLLAGLYHPNIPKVYDRFVFEGNDYMVMQFIEGNNLRDLCDQAGYRFSPKAACKIGITVSNVLRYLHSQKHPIILRDISPSNLMRTKYEGKLFVIDFGLAHVYDPMLSVDSYVQGNMMFRCPEIILNVQCDARSDIYSLAATLVYLLTGRVKKVGGRIELSDLNSRNDVPSHLKILLKQMLEPERAKRLVGAEKAWRELKEIYTQLSGIS